jgi:hypothetical protein
MPISYRVDDAAGVIRYHFEGRLTIEEFRQTRVALDADPRYRPHLHRLTDIRELTALPSIDEMREFARISATLHQFEPPTVRRGVIVASSVAYGVVRQYQTFLSLAGYDVDILVGDAEAAQWLAGLPARIIDSPP